ncbi:MAG TPA: DUF2336 domain-containing protein [Stellaceae bacterium]|nr:DUF2336 domain-containing protein [Stellaceae bacterium]
MILFPRSAVTALGEGELGHLLQLSRDKHADGRRTLAAAIADLFRAGGRVLSDRERFLMSDILRQLVKQVETSIRHALAERLAEDRDAPREVLAVLRRDAVDLALPILRRSEVLQDVELIEIVKYRALEHQLADAMRNQAKEPAASAPPECGNGVIRLLLQNSDAAIKAATMDYLIDQSRRVDTFQNPLLQRRELSQELCERLYWWVAAALRQHVLEHFDIDPTVLDRAVEDSVEAIVPREKRTQAPAAGLARRLAIGAGAAASLLADTLRQGEVDLFREIFGRLTGLRRILVNRLMFEAGGEGLAIACKAIGLSTDFFLELFVLTRSAAPTAGGDTGSIRAFFDSLDRRAAQRTLKAWRRHPAYQHAIWQVETTTRAAVLA